VVMILGTILYTQHILAYWRYLQTEFVRVRYAEDIIQPANKTDTVRKRREGKDSEVLKSKWSIQSGKRLWTKTQECGDQSAYISSKKWKRKANL